VARIDDYKESFRLACEELKRAELHRLALSSGVEITVAAEGETVMRIPFLGTPYLVVVGAQVEVRKEAEPGEVSLPEKILLAHYLLHASGKPLTGELITFRQIPDGHFYFDAFQRRARDPFLATFGRQPERFRECAQRLGGHSVANGDVGMAFQVLPRIPIQLILWQGDEELSPEAGILFDSSIQHNLAAEDIAVLSGMLVYRLMGMARSMEQEASRQ
jgi:hypothetical protein